MGLLGACSAIACEMPRWCAIPLAFISIVHGGWLARAHARRPRHALVWPMEGDLMIDGLRTQAATLQRRGPLVFLRWLDGQGRSHRLAWWPDTLPRAQRRELRLAAASAPRPPVVASMAP
jgi:toxin CptA